MVAEDVALLAVDDTTAAGMVSRTSRSRSVSLPGPLTPLARAAAVSRPERLSENGDITAECVRGPPPERTRPE
jgi:hypothetical protein